MALARSEPKLRDKPLREKKIKSADAAIDQHSPMDLPIDRHSPVDLPTVADAVETHSMPPAETDISDFPGRREDAISVWTPWDMVLHQQAMVFEAFTSMVRVQQQLARRFM